MTNNFDSIVKTSKEVSLRWRSIPAPQRGEFIRQFGEELRLQKEALAQTITKEARKIKTESLGEVQEAIDMWKLLLLVISITKQSSRSTCSCFCLCLNQR